MKNILQLENLKKTYRQGSEGLEILKGISLTVIPAETVAVMGPSGCGKSTMISLIAGLDTPTSGRVLVDGKDLAAFRGAELNRFRATSIGIIFQQFHLLDHLTAFENVRLPLDLNGMPQADQKARELLDKVGLGHRENHFPAQLSRGECQRVAIARVLVMRPILLLADEPTGSLDVRTGQEVMKLIFDLAESEKVALLMATHDPAVAERCSRHLKMSDGNLH
jgi:putative ABC transport system ATP-binding protein